MLNKRNQTQRSSSHGMTLPQSSDLVNMDTFARTMAMVGDSWGVVHILCLVWMMVMKVYSVYEYFKLCIYVSECALYSHVYMKRVYSFCFFIFNKNEFCGYFCCFPLKKCNLGSRMPCLGSPRSPTFSLLYLFLNLALCSQKV